MRDLKLDTVMFACFILVLVGGIDLGIVGLFKVDVIYSVLGGLGRLIFIAMGAAAVYLIYKLVKKTDV